MADEQDDAALLAAIAAGDETACRSLVGRYLRSATLFAAQLTGDRDDAEDVVQSAFLVAIERAATLDPARPFAPWLFGVVRRLALKVHTRRTRRRALWERWMAHHAESRDASDAEIEAASDLEVVRRHLGALPEMQRACFELVVLRDVAIDHVAAMYEISPSTVRQHVFRARRALRLSLEPLFGARTKRWTGDVPTDESTECCSS